MDSIKIKGVSEDMEIFENKIVITPRGVMGFLVKGMKGSKEIPFKSITAIQFKEAGLMFSGYMQFTLPGGNESKGGLFAAASDENTFMFIKDVNDEMKKAKIFIQDKIDNHGKVSHTPSSSMADELIKLKSLKDSGAITDEEFNEMKSKVMKTAA